MSTDTPRRFERMLAWASWLLVSGLGVQLVTCFWLHALSFILFLTLGGLLTGAGTLLFLYSLVTSARIVEQEGTRPT